MTAQELKNSILQMAIQGKLVKQDPNDEPASVLLDKIKEERDKLIKEKKIKKEKYSEIYKDPSDNHYYEKFENGKINDITEEIPFEIPSNWKWVRHNDLFDLIGGSQPPKSKFSDTQKDGYVRLYQIRDYGDKPVPVYVDKKLVTKFSNKGDILLARYGASLGKVFWAEEGAYNVAITKVCKNYINNLILPEFVFLYYLSPIYQTFCKQTSRSAQAGFNKEDTKAMFFPLPPYNEQLRITKKYNKIIPFVSNYEEKNKQISFLNSNYKDELKKSILQYAIQGKLIKQNPVDEPAQKLIERILDEKRRLMKEKKIKKENLSIIYKDPSDNQFYEKFDDGSVVKLQSSEYDIPNNWCLARISQISSIVTKQTGFDYSKHIKPNLVTIKKENNLPMIQTKNFKGELFNLNTDYYIPIDIAKNFPKILLDSKCLLLSIVGASIGNIGIFSNKELCFLGGAICKVKLINEEMYKYLYYFLQSPQGYKEIMKNYKSTAQGTITVQDVRDIIIPMPPAKEQQRIVAKIDELFSLL